MDGAAYLIKSDTDRVPRQHYEYIIYLSYSGRGLIEIYLILTWLII